MQLTINPTNSTALKLGVEPGQHIILVDVSKLSTIERDNLTDYLATADQRAEEARKSAAAQRERDAAEKDEAAKIQATRQTEFASWLAAGMPGDCPFDLHRGSGGNVSWGIPETGRKYNLYNVGVEVAKKVHAEITRRAETQKADAERQRSEAATARLTWLDAHAPHIARALRVGHPCEVGIAQALRAWATAEIARLAPSLAVLDRDDETDSLDDRDTPSAPALNAALALTAAGFPSQVCWGGWTDDDTDETDHTEIVRIKVPAPWRIDRDDIHLEATCTQP